MVAPQRALILGTRHGAKGMGRTGWTCKLNLQSTHLSKEFLTFLLPADFAKLFFPESGFSSRQVTAQGCPTKCSEIREAGLSQLTTCADTADEAFDWDPRTWSGTWV